MRPSSAATRSVRTADTVARLYPPDHVGNVYAGLDALDIETLRGRFDPAAMHAAAIYPSGDWSEAFDYLAGHFRELRQFYARAAANGEAVMLVIT